jgi:hypothetical protein
LPVPRQQNRSEGHEPGLDNSVATCSTNIECM